MQKTKIHALLRAAASALVLIILLGAKEAECGPSTGGAPTLNATRVGDWLDDGEEFLMESETSRRILQAGKKTITYPSANPKLPFCDSAVYGSCIGKDNKIYKRPCDYQNTCGRKGQ
ncbi:PREDICTED: uncharacterized protein LOC105971487 [Erythranthe guttata]|uniref:uncharacterized protein LOC105971487 n=1 Tax=Erythranthe guttata TaxID=4155 RepID=UPI00064DA83A|nr:PREDICTED: uncharacterized protein LOC105971487 [Erythranthe guttata]|eukprot:XP_012851798.1 PREDICTED: uncharacterized protein LOC105971487 [Erythranthe guttata]